VIGDKIKEILEKKGMTQAELAEIVEISEGHMNRIIKGKSSPAYDKVERIAAALNIPMEAFHNKEITSAALAQSLVSQLPKDIVEALADKRNRDWIMLGVALKDTQLSQEDINVAVQMYKQISERERGE